MSQRESVPYVDLGSLNHGLGRVTTHNKSISYN